MSNENPLATRLREVLKEHQRDGLSMIGNVDKLVGSLVRAVEDWIDQEKPAEKKTA
jgi:Txe/YoeB family toxin of Txe-Axe toxin-antitoxin module